MDPSYWQMADGRWQMAGYGVGFPFDNYQRIADFMQHCKGRVMVSVSDHPERRREFEGFHFEIVDIRYSTTSQRQLRPRSAVNW